MRLCTTAAEAAVQQQTRRYSSGIRLVVYWYIPGIHGTDTITSIHIRILHPTTAAVSYHYIISYAPVNFKTVLVEHQAGYYTYEHTALPAAISFTADRRMNSRAEHQHQQCSSVFGYSSTVAAVAVFLVRAVRTAAVAKNNFNTFSVCVCMILAHHKQYRFCCCILFTLA